MQIIKLPYKFEPRAYQLEIMREFFINKKKRMILIQHRRAGKDLLCFNIMVTAALQRVGTYVYALPLMKQARKVMWEGMDKAGNKFLSYIPPSLIKHTHDTKMSVYLPNGSIITFTGSDNYDAMMGTNPVGLVLSECALQHPHAWHFMSPILRENGGWVIFNGTPRGHNHAYELYQHNIDNPDWYVQTRNITTTEIVPGVPVVSESDIEEEIRAGMRPELIQQEYYCSFDMPIPGSYYSEEITQCIEEGRIYDFPIDKNKPVYTVWDLGYTDACAIGFFQIEGSKIKIINYYEKTKQKIKTVANYVHEFGKKHGLTYKMHFAPHDIMQQTQFGDGKTRIQEAADCGIRFHIVPTKDAKGKKIYVEDGINAVRSLYDRFHFHKTNTDLLIRASKHYHAKYSELFGVYGAPQHDWSSHGNDVMRYFSMIWSTQFANMNSFAFADKAVNYQSTY